MLLPLFRPLSVWRLVTIQPMLLPLSAVSGRAVFISQWQQTQLLWPDRKAMERDPGWLKIEVSAWRGWKLPWGQDQHSRNRHQMPLKVKAERRKLGKRAESQRKRAEGEAGWR